MELLFPKAITPDLFAGDNLVCYDIQRQETEAEDFTRLEAFLSQLQGIGPAACQRALFSFAGYADDPRELWQVPGVVSYAREVTRRFPCFWYYAVPTNSHIFIMSQFIAPVPVLAAPPAEGVKIPQDKVLAFIDCLERQLKRHAGEIGDRGQGFHKAGTAWVKLLALCGL